MRIKKLPSYLANQIAAGEVVERPASILKELLENSIDAESKNISVEIKNGGINLIKVNDDGLGIYKEDLPLACVQHATSKIRTQEDLEKILSLGFRGEALASIASISKLEIISKPQDQNVAWKLVINGNMDYVIEPATHGNGTTVIMRDIFFNVPARRHFLRSDKTEYFHVEEIFKRIALSNFNVAMTFVHNNKLIFKLPIADNTKDKANRLSKIFGRSFITKSRYIETKIENMELFGWIMPPEHCKTQATDQYFYINNRIIKDKVITHAIKQAYLQFNETVKSPNYCLFFNINADEIDVNVHPTKHEVRFKNSRVVHSFITETILNFLQNITSKNYQLEENIELNELYSIDKFNSDHKVQHFFQNETINEITNNKDIKAKQNYINNINKEINNNKLAVYKTKQFVKPVKQELFNNKQKELTTNFSSIEKSKMEITVLHIMENKVAITLLNDKLAVFNLSNLIKITLYTLLKAELDTLNKIKKSNLIIPKSINLNLENYKNSDFEIEKNILIFNEIGFDLSFTGERSCIIRSIPKLLLNYDFNLEELITVILNKLSNFINDKKTVIESLLYLIIDFVNKSSSFNISKVSMLIHNFMSLDHNKNAVRQELIYKEKVYKYINHKDLLSLIK